MRAKLLIIDSDNPFWQQLARHLADQGFAIAKADPTADLDQLIAVERANVILLDMSDLGYRGLTILEQIKKIAPHTEVITLNTAEHIDLSIQGMKRGAFDDFIIPVDMDELAGRLHQACRRTSTDLSVCPAASDSSGRPSSTRPPSKED